MKRKEIQRVVSEILKDNIIVIHKEPEISDVLTDDLGFDSLDGIEFIMQCEKRFNIAIDYDKAFGLQTIGDVIEYLYTLIN